MPLGAILVTTTPISPLISDQILNQLHHPREREREREEKEVCNINVIPKKKIQNIKYTNTYPVYCNNFYKTLWTDLN